MRSITTSKKVNGEPYDYRGDFMILSAGEKQKILNTAKNLLRQQRENKEFLEKAIFTNEEVIQIR